jgi:hypothetical protein
MMLGGTRATRDAVARSLIRTRINFHGGSWPDTGSGIDPFYSEYQLLAVPALIPFIDAMHLPTDFDIKGPLPWTLDGVNLTDLAPMQGLPLVSERLIVWLSVLEPVWLPSIVQQVVLPHLVDPPEKRLYEPAEFSALEAAHRASYFEYRKTVPAETLLSFMGATVDEVADEADKLLREADHIDPLGRWLAVIRLAPGRWKELRREAVSALDHRIAAELLMLLLHQLADEGLADVQLYGRTGDMANRHADSRLLSDDSKRDGVLTDFDLSPHPISLVVIEGSTEQILAPRIMETIGLPKPPWPIRLHNGQSSDAKLDWIYRYISAVDVHEEIAVGFRPSRPIPHIFVVADPEGTRHDATARAKYRDKIIDHLCRDASASAGRPIPRDLFESHVRVDAWHATFEFSHFSDEDLAEALGQQCSNGSTAIQPIVSVARGQGLPRVSAVWQRLREAAYVNRDLDKPALAEALWPALQARLRSATKEAELREIPIVATLLDAYRPVVEYPWGHSSYVPAAFPANPA